MNDEIKKSIPREIVAEIEIDKAVSRAIRVLKSDNEYMDEVKKGKRHPDLIEKDMRSISLSNKMSLLKYLESVEKEQEVINSYLSGFIEIDQSPSFSRSDKQRRMLDEDYPRLTETQQKKITEVIDSRKDLQEILFDQLQRTASKQNVGVNYGSEVSFRIERAMAIQAKHNVIERAKLIMEKEINKSQIPPSSFNSERCQASEIGLLLSSCRFSKLNQHAART